ncbi:Pentatricopeptide repeat-containing protein [Acorus calamus]|uniref:Pentatricopeptide repeat-containing protein n=1 Tax=Acorus calamus TaxID=4465 RepID=A0AAV9CUF6_ACOCL|nr:Pentatricopeptide repeat-containing protein [Acorus calamus]
MEAKGISVSSVSYNHAIGARESARKPRVALQVYQQMMRKRCEPDTFTYLSLISVCVWGSLWVEVENILEKNKGINAPALIEEFSQTTFQIPSDSPVLIFHPFANRTIRVIVTLYDPLKMEKGPVTQFCM